MSAHENALTEALRFPVTETHASAAEAAGDAVMRVLAGLDANEQMAALKWAMTRVRRRAQPKQERSDRHPVTRGAHDAEILQWKAEGLTDKAIAARLGCQRQVVNARRLVLRRKAR